MFRTIWFAINTAFWTAYYGSKVVIAGWLRVPNTPGGVFDRTARDWTASLLRASGAPQKIVGIEKVPRDEQIVFVCNHQSAFDVLLVGKYMPGRNRFVFKKELTKAPFLGPALVACGHIVIDRNNRHKAFGAYEEAAEAIKSGFSATVFAEGTRSRTGELLPFKKGPFVLAIAAQVKVVPVYCAGTFEILRKGSWLIRPQPIGLFFGDPIPTAGMDYTDRHSLLETSRKAIEQLRDEARTQLG